MERQPVSLVVKKVLGVEAYQRARQQGKTKAEALGDGFFQVIMPILSENVRRYSEGRKDFIFGQSYLGVTLQMLLDIGITAGTLSMTIENLMAAIAIKTAYNAAVAVESNRAHSSNSLEQVR